MTERIDGWPRADDLDPAGTIEMILTFLPADPPSTRLDAFTSAHPTETLEITVTAANGAKWTGNGYFMANYTPGKPGPTSTAQLHVWEDSTEPPF